MPVTRAELDKEPHEVAAMFDGVAERYDLTNDVLSLGQTRLWRRAVARAVDAKPGERVLDLAAGTGSSSLPFVQAGARVVAGRLLPRHAPGRQARPPDLDLLAGDALQLPFADGVFDAVTISFGLRNVSDVDAGLAEMARVTRPGGRLVVCEFSHPTWTPFRTVYTEYLMRALPSVARRVSSNPDAYVYLAESIRAWPDQAALAERIGAAGWTAVGWRNLTGGIVDAAPRASADDGVSAPRRRQRVAVEHDLTSSAETEAPMGADDKTQNKVDEITGDAKERIGGATGNDESVVRARGTRARPT